MTKKEIESLVDKIIDNQDDVIVTADAYVVTTYCYADMIDSIFDLKLDKGEENEAIKYLDDETVVFSYDEFYLFRSFRRKIHKNSCHNATIANLIAQVKDAYCHDKIGCFAYRELTKYAKWEQDTNNKCFN